MTPFYIQGSGNEVGKPFPWVVSDFSLLEAIEAGLVKVPRLPHRSTSGDDTPAYFNIWRWVQKRAQQDGHIGPITATEVMRYATAPIMLLADEWRRTIAEWKEHFNWQAWRGCTAGLYYSLPRHDARKGDADWLAEGDEQYGPVSRSSQMAQAQK
ncbi:MAG: hypothetical protein U5K38_01740 [Woeseiaceae bacterium]|nr:hypothetical protein [Woeseiaceae bacterium]